MGIRDLFALAAQNLVNRYMSLIQIPKESDGRWLSSNMETPPALPEEPPTDSFEPSEQLPDTNLAEPAGDDLTGAQVHPNRDPESHVQDNETAPPPEPTLTPEGTYFFRRAARLDCKLGLRFDLQAVTQTVEQLSEGDLQALERFSAADFGLTAAMHFKGKQVVETNMPAAEGDLQVPAHISQRSLFHARQMQQIAVHSRNFAAQAFQRQATDVMTKLKVTDHDGYRRVVNKFSYRFMMDTRFGFSFLERLNVQTPEVAEQMPESLGGYLTSAGNVAEAGTPEMMAAFFDAVNAYLDHAEEQIIDKVNSFFDMAAEQLGMPEGLIDVAREHLLGAVEGFFERVDESLAGLQSRFVPSELVQPTMPINEPTVVPVEYPNPAEFQEQEQLAVA